MIRAGVIGFAFCASPVSALTLADCERVTHVSHGGEAAHQDFGDARVGWIDWWSQEGVYIDITVANCKTGEFLKTRVREERVSVRAPFDRRDAVERIIATEMSGAAALFSFTRLAAAIHPKGRDIEIARMAAESCGCAAAYPDLRGDKVPYEASE